jgi:glycolate oxidase FAD binding subunit
VRSASLLHVTTLAAHLEDLLGSERVSMRTQPSIQGIRARLEVQPGDTGELAKVLAMADEQELGVCIAGGGTKLGWGNPPSRFDVLLRTSRLAPLCEVDADDLTITVSASTLAGDARAAAQEKGRVLPVDGRQPGSATMGGVVATADQGPRGAGYGGIRDLVLGVRAVLADGTPVKFGGRTMKNVAGYDMSKLFVGSFGVLGVVSEMTLRLLPRPDSEALMLVPAHSLGRANEIAAQILDAGLQPFVLEVLSGHAVAQAGSDLTGPAGTLAEPGWLVAGSGLDGEPGWVLLLAGFWGHKAAVERSIREVRQLCGATEGIVLRDGEAEAALDGLVDGAPIEQGVAAQASVPVSRVWSLAEKAERLAAVSRVAAAYRVGAVRGVLTLWGQADHTEAAESPAAEGGTADASYLTVWLEGVRREALNLGGQLAVTAGYEHLSEGFDAWGESRPSTELMRRVKERFDPRGTLNAGRFVGGI